MASITDAILDEAAGLFKTRPNPFNPSDPGPNSLTQDPGSPLEPSGWVNNSVSTVIIDENGITITDGALTFVDAFGSTIISGAGFGASWLDFISEGFYNGHFQVGTTTNITAATIVGTASTVADYAASQSDDIPYWVVASESGAGTLKRVADSTAAGGFALQWDGTETAEIFQDIPIVPGQLYAISLMWRYTNSASDFDMTVGCQFRKSDHSVSATATIQETGLNYTTSRATYIRQMHNGMTLVAPSDARYLRVFIEASRASGSPTIWLNGVTAVPKLYLDTLNIGDYSNSSAGISFKAPSVGSTMIVSSVSGDTQFRWLVTHNGKFDWGSGSATGDVSLSRSTVGRLNLQGASTQSIMGVVGTSLTTGFAVADTTHTVDPIFLGLLSAVPSLQLGSGSATRDVWVRRSAAKTLVFDTNGSSGDLTLITAATDQLFIPDGFIAIERSTEGVSAYNARVAGDANQRFQVLFHATGASIGLGGGTAAIDTNIYRNAANDLKTDDHFYAADGMAMKVKAGVPSDADFTVDQSGNFALDTTNSRFYVRVGSTWKSVAVA